MPAPAHPPSHRAPTITPTSNERARRSEIELGGIIVRREGDVYRECANEDAGAGDIYSTRWN